MMNKLSHHEVFFNVIDELESRKRRQQQDMELFLSVMAQINWNTNR